MGCRDEARERQRARLDEARRAKSGLSSPTSRRPSGLSRAVNVSGSPDNKRFLLEEMGCGVALFDYDNDGWLDIFLVNGSSFDPKVRDSKPSSYLFHNNRDGTFTDVTAKAGLTRSGWGQACCVGDYDNDGFDDLFVTYWGHNVLYHNNGDGTFTDVTAKAGVAGSGNVWGAGCSFLDYDRDGHLDLFVASYVNFDPARAPQPGQSAYCTLQRHSGPLRAAGICRGHQHPLSQPWGRHIRGRLGSVGDRPAARARLNGVCRQQLAAHGIVRHGSGGGGFRQRRLAGHLRRLRQRAEPLYRNNHDGTFREIAVPAGCALDENGIALSGMGVGVGDFDADGWLDIVRTNFSEQVTTLYRNYGGAFADASIKAGLGVNRKYLGFGVGFFDFDNDAWKDIFIANGHVYAQIANRNLHIKYRQPKLLYRNRGNGRFEDVPRRRERRSRREPRSRLRVR